MRDRAQWPGNAEELLRSQLAPPHGDIVAADSTILIDTKNSRFRVVR